MPVVVVMLSWPEIRPVKAVGSVHCIIKSWILIFPCVCSVLLNAIYYYESDGMLVAVVCVASDVTLALAHLHNTDECQRGAGPGETASGFILISI